MAVSNVELRVNATQAVTALRNVDAQAKKFNTTVTGTSGKLKATTGSLKVLPAAFNATGTSAKGAAAGIGLAGKSLVAFLGPIAGFTTAIGAVLKVVGNLAAADFASAKVKTLGVDADVLKPKLASLSNELSGQVSQLALLSASYDVASAGFGEVSQLTDVLKASQLGATGGFSDLATVADATTSVLNAYGLESDKAAKLIDGFIQTQNDGKIVVEQYAQQIGRLAPIAAGAGVGIDELNAAISTVTATGVPVESTFAGLRQVIASIQKPTSEAAKAAEKLGIDFSATALKTKGLSGVLAEVVEKGGASEETLALLFGSVEARTAILPLLNDQLVTFNKNLENQADAQGVAARAAFEAQNTIQGQLTRLGSAFTNLTTEGSEFGIIIRESLKVAAVTVEALGAAFKIVLAPVRAVSAAVGQIGKIIGESLGIDGTNALFNLEQGWIGIKEAITDASDRAVFIGKVIGGVIGNSIKVVTSFINGVRTKVGNLAQGIVDFFRQAFEKIVSFIPEPLRKLLGGLEIPEIDLKIKGVKEFGKNFLKGAQNNLNKLKEGVLEFSGIEKEITKENEKQLDAKNKIVDATGLIKDKVEQLTPAEKRAREEAEKLKETFRKIGESVRDDLVNNLTDAVMGAKSFGDAMRNVLGNLQRQLIKLALNKALTGIGNALSGGKGFGGFLGGLFGKERGGRVSAGGAFVVGERGPELLQMGSKGGTIIPNSQLGDSGGGGGITNVITVNVDASGSAVEGSDAQANDFGNVLASAIQAALVNEKRAGGLLSNA